MTEGTEKGEGTAKGEGSAITGEKHWLSHETSQWVEHAQDILSGAVAVTMVLLAAAILIGGIVDFVTSVSTLGLADAATFLVDKVLLVLILVEIVHTVVLSLRAHALVAQPFVVVGLVAVIRKILFVLAGQQKIDVTTLALYIGMVAVFVAALVAIEILANRKKSGEAGREGANGLL